MTNDELRKRLENWRNEMEHMDYSYEVETLQAAIDSLELLREQEPRVIDISEIYTAKKLDVWIEDKGDNIAHPIMLIETEMTNKSQTAFFYPMLVRPIKAYGKTWRCWTARPTDEQREATPWDELPKEET